GAVGAGGEGHGSEKVAKGGGVGRDFWLGTDVQQALADAPVVETALCQLKIGEVKGTVNDRIKWLKALEEHLALQHRVAMGGRDEGAFAVASLHDTDSNAINGDRRQRVAGVDDDGLDVGLGRGQEQAAGVAGTAVEVTGGGEPFAETAVIVDGQVVLVPDVFLVIDNRLRSGVVGDRRSG